MRDEHGGRSSEVGNRTVSACALRPPTSDLRSLVPRVVKLGGSLLTWPEWPAAFRRWSAMQPERRTVLIAGGGGAADTVRDWDRAHNLDQSDAHWLAIDAMSVTAQLAARLLPEAALTDDWCVLDSPGWPELNVGVPPLGGSPSATAKTPAPLLIFDPRLFLQQIEPTAGGTPLPHSWDVTSDSIAARIADLLGSEELVLFKSCLPAAEIASLEQTANAGYVDGCFPEFASKLPLVRLVNLRDSDFAEARLTTPARLASEGRVSNFPR
jgi:5-(aminomethyl)-3-furanmethanol phosphate kinase